MTWTLILHGGAKQIERAKEAANRRGCLEAIAAGCMTLSQGGSALAAVETVVRVLEDDPVFNAGIGSVANAAGDLEMDAALMDGQTLDVGGVAALRGVRYPITVARMLLREQPTLLVAEGARQFALDHGAELMEPEAMLAPEELSKRDDTVGCVALDADGNLAAGVSTGGLPGCAPGRVGDTPLPGCGFYADNALGAVALSGDGESIARLTLGAQIMHGLKTLPPEAAAELALASLNRVGGEAGAIVLDRRGTWGWAHASPHFAVAYASSEQRQPRVYLKKSEER
jgi:beta-aspartyl-peptidase (threonine type)